MSPKREGPHAFLRRIDEEPPKGKELPIERVRLERSRERLLANFQIIQELAGDRFMLPMLKADAYGHGMEWAAKTLLAEPKLFGFGVATLTEGEELRAALGARHRKLPVICFSGATGWSEQKAQRFAAGKLTPVLTSVEDVRSFVRRKDFESVSWHIMFNTGMNRLGIATPQVTEIADIVRKLPENARPEGILSHLACAEAPNDALTERQLKEFSQIERALRIVLPSGIFHLANSAGIWNEKLLSLSSITQLVRPGLSLYGIPPWAAAPVRGLQPVMAVEAPVLQVHKLKSGDRIGYGGTFRVTGTEPTYAAILDVGYADGLHRSLSNQGWVWLGERRRRILGVVSMDLCAVECDPTTAPGQWAELWGPNVNPWEQAQAAQTIPYELMTSWSKRVLRKDG